MPLLPNKTKSLLICLLSRISKVLGLLGFCSTTSFVHTVAERHIDGNNKIVLGQGEKRCIDRLKLSFESDTAMNPMIILGNGSELLFRKTNVSGFRTQLISAQPKSKIIFENCVINWSQEDWVNCTPKCAVHFVGKVIINMSGKTLQLHCIAEEITIEAYTLLLVVDGKIDCDATALNILFEYEAKLKGDWLASALGLSAADAAALGDGAVFDLSAASDTSWYKLLWNYFFG